MRSSKPSIDSSGRLPSLGRAHWPVVRRSCHRTALDAGTTSLQPWRWYLLRFPRRFRHSSRGEGAGISAGSSSTTEKTNVRAPSRLLDTPHDVDHSTAVVGRVYPNRVEVLADGGVQHRPFCHSFSSELASRVYHLEYSSSGCAPSGRRSHCGPRARARPRVIGRHSP